MASKKIYTPSVLEQIEEIEDWVQELAIWQCVTDVEPNKLFFNHQQQYPFWGGGVSPNCHSSDNVETCNLPWTLENWHHLQKPIMNSVAVGIGLDTRFEQTENLLG